jgi:hypothetical protein
MVDKFTFLELHLDDARFSNAVGSTPEKAAALLDEMDGDDVDADDADESSGRSVGRTLGQLAFFVVLAVGIRAVARRLLASEDADGVETTADSVAVGVDDLVEA